MACVGPDFSISEILLAYKLWYVWNGEDIMTVGKILILILNTTNCGTTFNNFITNRYIKRVNLLMDITVTTQWFLF